MSNRTMLEINHDKTPFTQKDKDEFIDQLCAYLYSGDPKRLPRGVTWFGMRHHSEKCPMGEPPKGWENIDA